MIRRLTSGEEVAAGQLQIVLVDVGHGETPPLQKNLQTIMAEFCPAVNPNLGPLPLEHGDGGAGHADVPAGCVQRQDQGASGEKGSDLWGAQSQEVGGSQGGAGASAAGQSLAAAPLPPPPAPRGPPPAPTFPVFTVWGDGGAVLGGGPAGGALPPGWGQKRMQWGCP